MLADSIEINSNTDVLNLAHNSNTDPAVVSGENAIAIGGKAQATEGYTIALGNIAVASGSNAVAIGHSASAGNQGAYAIGNGAKATGSQSIALGVKSKSSNIRSTAVGEESSATGVDAVALETKATATGLNSISIGAGNTVSGAGSGAIGDPTTVSGHGTYTVGNTNGTVNANNSGIFGNNNTIIGAIEGVRIVGNNNIATVADAMIMGNSSEAKGTGTIAIGSKVKANGSFATAVGNSSEALKVDSLAFGVSAKAYGDYSVAIGSGAKAFGQSAVALSNDSHAPGEQAVAIGRNTFSKKLNTVAIGQGAVAGSDINLEGDHAVAIGSTAKATANNSVSIGKANEVRGANSGIIGSSNSTDSDDSHTTRVNILTEKASDTYVWGNNNGTGNAKRSMAFGNNNNLEAEVEGIHILGNNNTVTTQGGTVVGNFSRVAAADAAVIGNNAIADQANSVTLGTNSVIDPVVSTASATINGTTYNYAGGEAKSTISVGANDRAGAAGDAYKHYYRTITNVVAGRISSSSTDAINGSQLYSLKTEVERGLNFSGDTASGATNQFNRTLGNEVKVTGGVTTKDTLTDRNIGVVSNGSDTLTVKLSKDIHLGTSGSVSVGRTTITSRGISTNGGVEITNNGINAGNKVISHVASGGTADNNAANIADVKKASSSVTGGTNIASISKSSSAFGTVYIVNAKGTAVAEGANTHISSAENSGTNVTTYTVNADKTTVSAKPAGTDKLGVTVIGTPVTDSTTGAVTTDYGVDLNADTKAAINNSTTNIANNTSNITELQSGFTVSNEAGAKQTITLGGDAKQNIQFKGEADKIDVSVDNAADGATVTVTTDPKLGQNIDISNNTTVNSLKAGFDLKAGTATSNVALGGTKPIVEFAAADDTTTVALDGMNVIYGVDKAKLAQNITGDMITNINNATTTPITNISAQFGVTADSGNQKNIALEKGTTPTVKFEGDGKYLKSATTAGGVKYSVDETQLNNTITNNTTVQQNKTDITSLKSGFNVTAGGDAASQSTVKAGETLNFAAGDNAVVSTVKDSKTYYLGYEQDAHTGQCNRHQYLFQSWSWQCGYQRRRYQRRK